MPLEYVQKSGVKGKKNVVFDFKIDLIFTIYPHLLPNIDKIMNI